MIDAARANGPWPAPGHIRVGLPAPPFEALAYVRRSHEAVHVSLQDYRGRWLVLFFYRKDFSYVCPTELAAFARLQDAFDREGASILGVSADGFESHRSWLETDPRLRDVRFPLAADTSYQLSHDYGVVTQDGPFPGYALRGLFVIDPTGVLRHMLVNDDPVGRDPAETLRVVRALRTGRLCGADWKPGDPHVGPG